MQIAKRMASVLNDFIYYNKVSLSVKYCPFCFFNIQTLTTSLRTTNVSQVSIAFCHGTKTVEFGSKTPGGFNAITAPSSYFFNVYIYTCHLSINLSCDSHMTCVIITHSTNGTLVNGNTVHKSQVINCLLC